MCSVDEWSKLGMPKWVVLENKSEAFYRILHADYPRVVFEQEFLDIDDPFDHGSVFRLVHWIDSPDDVDPKVIAELVADASAFSFENDRNDSEQ